MPSRFIAGRATFLVLHICIYVYARGEWFRVPYSFPQYIIWLERHLETETHLAHTRFRRMCVRVRVPRACDYTSAGTYAWNQLKLSSLGQTDNCSQLLQHCASLGTRPRLDCPLEEVPLRKHFSSDFRYDLNVASKLDQELCDTRVDGGRCRVAMMYVWMEGKVMRYWFFFKRCDHKKLLHNEVMMVKLIFVVYLVKIYLFTFFRN